MFNNDDECQNDFKGPPLTNRPTKLEPAATCDISLHGLPNTGDFKTGDHHSRS